MTSKEQYNPQEVKEMGEEERKELEQRSKGETVVEGGRGGKSLEAQMHLKEGRTKGGLSTSEQSGEERMSEIGESKQGK